MTRRKITSYFLLLQFALLTCSNMLQAHSSFSSAVITSSPVIDYITLELMVETDASIQLQARELAMHQQLPISIQVHGVALIEAKSIENGQVVYTVITNFQKPRVNGYTAFFAQIEQEFELENATKNYGFGVIVEGKDNQTSRWVANSMLTAPDHILLIPESTNDAVMAFDRMTGDLISMDFVPADPDNLSTPICALPNRTGLGDIYLSDQLDDVVQRYDENGVYQGVFAPDGMPNTAILDNIRGIEWTPNNTLLVSIGGGANDDGIAEFDETGAYIGNLIANGAGGLNSPFDILYWETNDQYVVPGITSDAVHLYDNAGNFVINILESAGTGLSFPEQVTELPDGSIAVAEFSGGDSPEVYIIGSDYTLLASIESDVDGLRGVYQLGNGNLLLTNGGGVHEVDMNGILVETKVTGVSARFIEEYGEFAVAGECGLVCPTADIEVNLGPGECTATVNFAVQDTGSCAGSSLDLVNGFDSGSEFPIGTTNVRYELTDMDGNLTASCSFTVTVNEFSSPTLSLACNDYVNISLDNACRAIVNTDMILEGGPYGCYDDYMVTVEGVGSGLGSVVLPGLGEYVVSIMDPNTGNSCWGEILVEDKIPPVVECAGCEAETVSGSLSSSSGIWNRPFVSGTACAPSGTGTATYYEAFSFTVTAEDNYTFLGDAPFDGIGALYAGAFDPTDPCANLIAWDDVVGPGLNPLLEIVLTMVPGDYTLVMTSFFNDEVGDYTWTISSDAGGQVFSPEACEFYCNDVAGLLNGSISIPDPLVDENCTYTTTFIDEVSGECPPVFTRTYTVTDAGGNVATCALELELLIPSLDAIEVENYVGDCTDSLDPSNTGYPSVNGTEIMSGDAFCGIFYDYWDKPITDCGGAQKIIRYWSIVNWCDQESREILQIIKLSDDEGPVITCPGDMEVGTDFWFCYANVSVPKPTVVDACGSEYTLSLSASAGIVRAIGNNYVINELPLGENEVTWTAIDACGNESSCTFIIEVVDEVPPVPNCDEHTIVSLTNDAPYGITLVSAEVFDDGSYDNCSEVTFEARRMETCIDFDWTTNGACVDDVPNGIFSRLTDGGMAFKPCVPFACCDVAQGPIMIELKVTDAAGNENFCMVEVEVQDKLAPFIECPPNIVVSCDFWFDSEVVTGQRIPLSQDPMTSVFGTVLDAYEVHDDQSARQPVVINDPGRPTNPSNEYYLPQPYTWGIDGWADDNCDVNLDVRITIEDDCSGDDLPANAPDHAIRYIERRFTATDGQNNSDNCRQVIWVVDFDPFYISDETCADLDRNDGVKWPCDKLYDTCPDSIPVDEPIIYDDNCSLIGVIYEDTRFDFVDGACYKILREWTVIDWCQYETNTGAGIWYYTQVIKVIDSDGPEFLDCPEGPITLCAGDAGVSLPDNNQVFLGEANPNKTSCSVHVSGNHTVQEFCSDYVIYDVKVFPFNGIEYISLVDRTQVDLVEGQATISFDTKTAPVQQVRLNGLPYNNPYCLPNGQKEYHRILWSVEDGCGNLSTCEYLVRLEDCKQPSPVCVNGLSTVVMPIGGSVVIWAKEYDVSSIDDCTPSESLTFSFSGDSYQPSAEYNCENVPAFGAELEVNVWVADEGNDHNCNGQIEWSERNKDFCTTTIVITDNDGVCPNSGNAVAGEILTYTDLAAVENTLVTIQSATSAFPTVVTADDGKYNFIVPAGDYTIEAERNDDYKNGVSTLDLVRIQKHLLGVEPFTSPYDLIAADANNSESVSAIDLVEIRKLILGIYTEYPANESWRFVDPEFEFTDPAQPWPFSEVLNVNASVNQMHEDFMAIKVGDLNNTVVANATQVVIRNANGTLTLLTNDREVIKGETIEVTFATKEAVSLLGYQFTMRASGLEFVDVHSESNNVTADHIGLIDGQVTTSWHHIDAPLVEAEAGLFTFEFVATQSGRLSQMLDINSSVTTAEAYNASSELLDVALEFRGNGEADFALYQNEPNPFNGVTVIGFDLPQASQVTLSVFDVNGKMIKLIADSFAKGYNRIDLSGKDMGASGVMYYRLDAGEYTATKKMIIIK